MFLKWKWELPKVFAIRRTRTEAKKEDTRQLKQTTSVDGPDHPTLTLVSRSLPISTIGSSALHTCVTTKSDPHVSTGIPSTAKDVVGRQPHDVTILALSALLPAAEAIPIAGPPMKAAIGGLLLILKAVDQISKNEEDIQALISKLHRLDNHINAIPAAGPPFDVSRDYLTERLNETSNALRKLHDCSKFKYSSVAQAIDQCSKDIDRYLLQYSALSNMQLEVYAQANDTRMKRVDSRVERMEGNMETMMNFFQTFTASQQTFTTLSMGFVHFVDATGLKHSVPMSMARSLAQFKEVIRTLFRPETSQGVILREYMDIGAYDLCINDGKTHNLLPALPNMEVCRVGPQDDHAAIKVKIKWDNLAWDSDELDAGASDKCLAVEDVLSMVDPESVLEQTLVSTLESALTDEEAGRQLYGPFFITGNEISVYICTAGNARANCAVAWRDNLCRKRKVQGSANRAIIVAVIMALLETAPNRALYIYTSSEYIVRSLVYLAGRHCLHGWGCLHADLLKIACRLLRIRSATTSFRMIKGNGEENTAWQSVKQVAKSCMENDADPVVDAPCEDDIPNWRYPEDAAPLNEDGSGIAKVTANIGNVRSEEKRTESSTLHVMRKIVPPTDVDHLSEAHRGRANTRRLMWQNLQRMSEMSESSAKKFWKFIQKRTDVKQRALAVSLDDLRDTFEKRMNPPPILPPEFDGDQFIADKIFSETMPDSTADNTDNHCFSRPFTSTEVDSAKRQIRSHTNSAKGIDGVEYAGIMDIPSQKLADLFNLCIATCDAPQVWLTTMLVGILKPGRPSKIPDSYRLIALECCLLKTLTLLIAQRFREWISATNILPEAQNGFRAGYRTNNCSFVLRCAIDRCRARGESLLALFIDLENAFPSTNLPTLWKKLADAGAKGPMIDWMRMIYNRMRYTVATQSKDRKLTEMFRSWWGILAGDSFSPDLFTFFIADCKPPEGCNDVILANLVISFLLLADDMAFLEILNIGGMQGKIDYMVNEWCPRNFLRMNVSKTKGMIFGPLPQAMPTLKVGDKVIEIVDIFKYVGVYFQSTHRFIFAAHYKKKADEAMKGIYQLVQIESYTGDLWPRESLRVFMARVDPHLVNACEVAIDVDLSSLKLLEDAQLFGIRRILRLSKWSIRAVLFTETGVIPLRYRRIMLAIRYIRYLLSIPHERFAYAAWLDSYDLLMAGKPGWMGDIKHVLMNLPIPVEMVNPGEAQ